MGYDAPQNYTGFDYNAVYGKEEYHGGIAPSQECLKIISLLPLRSDQKLKVLEICCGEGRNAVFFARCGYEVDAFDLSAAGIEKTKKLADKARVHVNAFKADMSDYRLDCKYDIIYSSSAFHFMRPEFRDEIIADYRKNTNTGGINAFHNVFVEKPFISNAPEFKQHSHPWRSGELLLYYHDWFVEDFSEYTIDQTPGYQCALNQIYARKK